MSLMCYAHGSSLDDNGDEGLCQNGSDQCSSKERYNSWDTGVYSDHGECCALLLDGISSSDVSASTPYCTPLSSPTSSCYSSCRSSFSDEGDSDDDFDAKERELSEVLAENSDHCLQQAKEVENDRGLSEVFAESSDGHSHQVKEVENNFSIQSDEERLPVVVELSEVLVENSYHCLQQVKEVENGREVSEVFAEISGDHSPQVKVGNNFSIQSDLERFPPVGELSEVLVENSGNHHLQLTEVENDNSIINQSEDGSEHIKPADITLSQSLNKDDSRDFIKEISDVPESPSFCSADEKDNLMRFLPGPDDEYDSVGYSDNNNIRDGTKWEQTDFSSHSAAGRSIALVEQRKSAMFDVMNGQFKTLVSCLLAAEGFSSIESVGCPWLEILVHLSWKAASLIDPHACEGKEMDPLMYVKVKCIASGSREKSDVIEGLVFKKNPVHKRMPMKFENPRLLLLSGIIGDSTVGLSSMVAIMKQEKGKLEKTIDDMMDICRPNVILVEQTVTRDAQEYLLKKGVTLICDMNLSRLERIARCTGSRITTFSEVSNCPNLKQCESFYIEKIDEELNPVEEDGKKVAKSLMFLIGFSEPLGCTVLLKGSNSVELKKIKRVVRYAVFAAYHLILETSYFCDQMIFFSDEHVIKEKNYLISDSDKLCSSSEESTSCDNKILFPPESREARELNRTENCPDGPLYPQDSAYAMKSVENGTCKSDLNGNCTDFAMVPAVSEKLPKDSVRISGSDILWSSAAESTAFSSCFDGGVECDVRETILYSASELKGMTKANNSHDAAANGISGHTYGDKCSDSCCENYRDLEKDAEGSLRHSGIVILMSSYCTVKEMMCEQSQVSQITFYRDLDKSLGGYLCNVLLNKRHTCSSCGESPEAHIYSFTHHNGCLTVLVKSLPDEIQLPGEKDGKIWMWIRCLRCKSRSGMAKLTKIVELSLKASDISLGKFLELSFSNHPAAKTSSKCGHLLHRDCIRFFGLGSRVASFRYSKVGIFSACRPPLLLDFYSKSSAQWCCEEAHKVYDKLQFLFAEVHKRILDMFSESINTDDSSNGAREDLMHSVLEILQKEKDDIEAYMKALDNGSLISGGSEIFHLNWIVQLLFLELYVWDRRLLSLIHLTEAEKERYKLASMDVAESHPEKHVNNASSSSGDISTVLGNGHDALHEFSLSTEVKENTADLIDGTSKQELPVDAAALNRGALTEASYAEATALECEDKEAEDVTVRLQHDSKVEIEQSTVELGNIGNNADNSLLPVASGDADCASKQSGVSQHLEKLLSDSLEKWIWGAFSELQDEYRRDLHGCCSAMFVAVNKYEPTVLSAVARQIKHDMDPLQFIVGPNGNVFSVLESQISSIIAYALCASQERLPGPLGEKETVQANGLAEKESDNLGVSNVDSTATKSSSQSLPASLVLSEGSNIYSDFLSFSSGESIADIDRSLIMALKDSHPTIILESERVAFKSKYTVVYVFAKQFSELRRICCPSEVAYISSLSRCKRWDAQGGKSNAIFAKTWDERFIIKQIKKTEFDSFLKFAPDYFKHILSCIDLKTPLCLAKILGIYQVRELKNGKEIRTDLMVMENVFFGRTISRIYDLKGAVFSRYVSGEIGQENVLLDQNFIEDMRVMPIYTEKKSYDLLQGAIENDTAFLTKINVMDYSLLVGIDKQKNEIVCGIIDYLRQYTWDKQLETWVKSSLVVPRNVTPTIISPKEYMQRFRNFMKKHFLTVPETGIDTRCLGSCEFCDRSVESSSSAKG